MTQSATKRGIALPFDMVIHMSQTHPVRRAPRSGIALATTIIALVIVGALIAGVFFTSTQEYRLTRNRELDSRALVASEYGLNAVIAGWDTSFTNHLLIPGDVVTRGYTVGNGATDTVRVTKLNVALYWIVSEAVAGPGSAAQARRRTAVLVQRNIPWARVNGAFSTRGFGPNNSWISGNLPTSLNGNDTSLAGWNCPPPTAPVAGLAVPATNTVQLKGSCTVPSNCLSGSQPVAVLPAVAADTMTYLNFGAATWPSLAASANIVLPSGASVTAAPSYNPDGSCNTASTSNWGDPNRNPVTPGKCEGYFPVIYAQGDLTLLPGTIGQGILLVGGTLSTGTTGPISFYGLIVVRGMLDVHALNVYGALMNAATTSTGPSIIGQGTNIRYSACALDAAFGAVASMALSKRRTWSELF
ncbi:MAG: hypothetical protein NVS9B3_00760 [Gemmatimonadaceae bacterium]